MTGKSNPPLDLELLRQWEGRTEVRLETLAPEPVAMLADTLDRADPEPVAGTELPPLAHWLYFLPRHRQSEVGPDGHPHRGGFLPPVPLPRRMWAGGRLQWLAPLRVGDVVEKTSRIESVTHKSGRSGDLVFVLVRHELRSGGALALVEEQDIVYRDAPRPGDPVPPAQPAETGAPWSRGIVPDPVLLFRYSALTFNGHRIHYDRSYATGEEGYPGLVVHGPLIATLLVDLLRREQPAARLRSFAFKAVRPTFDLHPFRVSGRPEDGGQAALWAQDHEDKLTMSAQAQFE